MGVMASLNVGNLGEYLREQRRNAQLSLRQLADAAGVSNPYLSQIERGLRKPSADILQQLAKALRISAETLYVQAGMLDEREREELETRAVILADPSINERQKQVLLQIYESFRKENALDPESTKGTDATDHTERSAGGRPEGGRSEGSGDTESKEATETADRAAGADAGAAGDSGDTSADGPRTADGSGDGNAATPPSH